MGLSICKQLVELLGGSIRAESQQGKGASFLIQLKIVEQDVQDKKTDRAVLANLQGKKIYVLDQQLGYSKVLKSLFKALNVLSDFDVNAHHTVIHFSQQKGDKNTYDLVIISEKINRAHAKDIIQRINKNSAMEGIPKLVLFDSANSLQENQEILNGLAVCAVRPVVVSQIKYKLADILSGKHSMNIEKKNKIRKEELSFKGMKILVAEDNVVNRAVILAMLKQFSVEPDVACDGKEALESVQVSDSSYDIILMDCEMPLMDGFEATSSIRAYEKQRHISPTPIVALTAHTLMECKERSKAAGMNGHLSKPLQIDDLKALLKHWYRVSAN